MAQLPYALVGKGASGRAGFGVGRRFCSLFVSLLLLVAIFCVYNWGVEKMNDTTIIIITPTHKRPERFADMTRFSQTLMHTRTKRCPPSSGSSSRSHIPYVYFYTTTKPGFPRRGWTHRNMGLEYVRKNYKNYRRNAVVYFADDDNSYDIRLFDRYVRNVKSIGVWAVGLAGGALVEAPHVENGTITKWDVIYAPSRKFATDMAGFAVNLQLILNTNASFHQGCVKVSPESCFLTQFKLERKDAQPFGYDDDPKEILVWHTKTKSIGAQGLNHGYITER
ncbi:Galactosylgalactosylxylosylprotein 3-beta-glucuronosyltransferase [Aphelenchoides fujianensis]|nr:Galactosylgalactosylxylosylprotein 3-beta-glucuronosyltransferase [Aphelenchoides fujianensis]